MLARAAPVAAAPRLSDSWSCSFWPAASDSGTKVLSNRSGRVLSAALPMGAGKFSASPCRLLATLSSTAPRLNPSAAV